MKHQLLVFLFICFSVTVISAQTIIKGSINDGTTDEPIPDVTVSIEGSELVEKTDANGEFIFLLNVPLGEQMLLIEKIGYGTKRYPIIVNEGKTVDIQDMSMEFDNDARDLVIISITENDLNGEDDGATDNISGLLQASRDVFLNAAAFDFSATFFRPRGLDNSDGKVLINGIEMNKLMSGRPQWANWGGLNDVQRNQEFTMGMSANDYTFSDLAGTTNMIMRASKYRKGGRLSYASANRSYEGRVMASYSSGLVNGGWSYTFLGSRRFGNEGYVDGTLYDANSLFLSVEKQLSETHSLNFSAIYAQNRRGRSTSVTEEVYNLRGNEYNPFWGVLNGEQRNSRIRRVNEPIFMLNHFWNISNKTSLNTNASYQLGTTGNTRIDNGGTRLVTFNGQNSYIGGANNPDPTYYQRLPSYFLRDSNPSAFDFEQAFIAQQQFLNDGQLDWNALYSGNANIAAQGGNSIYAIQEDRNDDQDFTVNTIVDSQISNDIKINGNISYRRLKSENFAVLNDLLGGNGFLDVDFFAEETDPNSIDGLLESVAQSDRRNPNRIVKEGERYKYNFDIEASVLNGFAQAQFNYKKIDFYTGVSVSQTSYQRIGLYENGNFPGTRSFGPSEKLQFSNAGFKGGLTYKISGRHLLGLNASYQTKAPTIRNSFSNSRQNNDVVIGLESENIQSLDVSYVFRSPIVKGRLTGYFSEFKDGTDIGFYFTEDLAGQGFNSGDAFVQEITTNIDTRNVGIEFGLEAQVTSTLKLKAIASVGQYVYIDDPDLYLTSDDFDGPLTFGDGKANLKNYHVPGGPERAYQLGFEYRDPDFWNFGLTTNYFSNAYIDVSNLARSANFSTDFDGQEIIAYDASIARQLLKQEKFDDYFLVNVTGGKSWRVKSYFIGFFATINNVLDQAYKTGGFEQSRIAKYTRLEEDQSRAFGPLFGARYFYGNGTTYYLNVYVRF